MKSSIFDNLIMIELQNIYMNNDSFSMSSIKVNILYSLYFVFDSYIVCI